MSRVLILMGYALTNQTIYKSFEFPFNITQVDQDLFLFLERGDSMEDMLAILFISILTILSSLLVIFFEVNQFTSWLVLGLSTILTLIAKRTVIASEAWRSHSNAQNERLSAGDVVPKDRFVSGVRSASDMTSPPRCRILAMTWGKFKKILYPIPYPLIVLLIILFYSRYQTTSSNPLVWTILPQWFLPALLIFIFLCVLFTRSEATKQSLTHTQFDEDASQSIAMQVWRLAKKILYPIPYTLYPIVFLLLPILFPVGTDYDPFVHRAAEHAIVEQGSIQPRTVLYSGEYGLVSVLSVVTSIPVKTINLFLLPLLMILTAPWFLKKAFETSSLILFFLLPFSILTTTVPQSLGIFFLFILICLHWRYVQESNKPKKQTNPSSSTTTEGVNNQDEQKKISIASEPRTVRGITLDSNAGYRGNEIASSQSPLAITKSFLFYFLDPNNRRYNDKALYIIRYTLYGLLAFASFLSHPFPGIAAFTFLGFTILKTLPIKPLLRRALALGTLMVTALLIPAGLVFNNRFDSQFAINAFAFNQGGLNTIKSFFGFGWIRYTDPLSFVHFFGNNYYLLFFIVILFATIQKVKIKRHCERVGASAAIFNFMYLRLSHQTHNSSQPPLTLRGGERVEDCFAEPRNDRIYLLSFLSISLSSFLVLLYLVPNVTEAEHAQLFSRLFSISTVFLWPIVLFHVSQVTYHRSQKTFHLPSSIFLSVLIVSNIYLQFPHSDRFVNFKGYLPSQSDLDTVRSIESTATKPYLVLANQSVGAAALDQFGFSQYVKLQASSFKLQNQFFYSIPISSRSQEYFLRMTKEPSEELINEIFETYEVKEFYLVLNDYWKNSRLISRKLSQTSNDTRIVGGNTIFHFITANR